MRTCSSVEKRLHGEEYVLTCTGTFSFDDNLSLIKSVYDRRPKNEQDSLLMGLMIRKDPVRKLFNASNVGKDNIFYFYVVKFIERLSL